MWIIQCWSLKIYFFILVVIVGSKILRPKLRRLRDRSPGEVLITSKIQCYCAIQYVFSDNQLWRQNVPSRWTLFFTHILDNLYHLVQLLCHCTDNNRLQMKLLPFSKNNSGSFRLSVQKSPDQRSPGTFDGPDEICSNSSFEKSFLQKVKIIESYLKWLKWWRA